LFAPIGIENRQIGSHNFSPGDAREPLAQNNKDTIALLAPKLGKTGFCPKFTGHGLCIDDTCITNLPWA